MNTCELHGSHRPVPLVIVKHHVQPVGMDGPDEAGNWRWTCDTGHRNVHTLLGPMCQEGPDFGVMPARGTVKERATAQEGFDKWVAAGKPGNPHAAFG